MKVKFGRLLSVLLCLALLFGSLSVFTLEVAAVEIIKPTGVFQSTVKQDGWWIWLRVGDNLPETKLYGQDVVPVTLTDIDGKVRAQSANNTTFACFQYDADVNGKYLIVRMYGGRNQFALYNQPQEGDQLTISAGTYYASTDSSSITLERDVVLYFLNGNWKMGYKIDETAEQFHGLNTVTWANQPTQIYSSFLQESNLTDAKDSWDRNRFLPADYESGAFVNGTRFDLGIGMPAQSSANAMGLWITGFGTAEIGTQVVVRGSFYSLQTGETLTFKTPVIFTYEGPAEESGHIWSTFWYQETYSGSLTLAGAELAGGNAAQLWLKGDDALRAYEIPEENNWEFKLRANNEQSGVFINGVRVSANLLKYHNEHNYWFTDGFTAVKDGDRMEIKGSFENAEREIEVTIKHTEFVWNASREKWENRYTGYLDNYRSQVPDTATPNGIYLHGYNGTEDLFRYGYEDGKWGYTKLLAADGDENGAFLNGVKIEVGFEQYSYNDQYYYMKNIPTPAAGDVLTIKGEFYDAAYAARVTFEESRFIWMGDHWIDDYTNYAQYTGTLTRVNAETPSSGNYYIYLTGDHNANRFKVGGNGVWDRPMKALDGDESGVFLNGVKIDSTIKKINDGLNTWYVDMEGFAANPGDVVVIKGAFTQKELHSTMNFEKCKFMWTGSEWVDYTSSDSDTFFNAFYNGGEMQTTLSANYIDGRWTLGFFIAEAMNAAALGETYAYFPAALSNGEIGKLEFAPQTISACGYGTATLTGVPAPAELTDGFTVTISGNADGTKGNTFNLTKDFRMIWDAAAQSWVMDWIEYSGTLTREDAENSNGTQVNHYIYLRGDADAGVYKVGGDNIWSKPFVAADGDQNGVFLNGVKQSGIIKKTHDSNNSWFAEGFSANVGDVVTIKGVFYSEDSKAKMTFQECSFKWLGQTWINNVDIAFVDTTVIGFDEATNRNDTRWQMYLDVSNLLPGAAWTDRDLYTVTVAIDGTPWSIQAKNAGGNGLYFEIPEGAFSADGEHTIVLKAGEYVSAGFAHGFRLTADFTLYVNAYGASTAGYITPSTTVKPTLLFDPNGANNSIAGFESMLSEPDGAPYNGDWSVATYGYNGVGDVGTFFFGPNGYWLDGELQSGTAVMKKLSASAYYIDLGAIQSNIQVGTILKVQGLFRDNSGYFVDFAPSAFRWNGDGWESVMLTDVERDINADGFVDVADAVWLEHYLHDRSVMISSTADVDGNGVINADDMVFLRRFILGYVIENANLRLSLPHFAGQATITEASAAPLMTVATTAVAVPCALLTSNAASTASVCKNTVALLPSKKRA